MEKVMKSLASTLSRQHGVQYEFGPEFDEYTQVWAKLSVTESEIEKLVKEQ